MADTCLRVGHFAKTGPEGPILDYANIYDCIFRTIHLLHICIIIILHRYL